MDKYDYLIVGGGSAGCVLANRLSADPAVRVCLLEAGPADRHPLIRMPVGIVFMMMSKVLNWRYFTEPQTHLNQRRLFWPRGKTLGGSSSSNAMVYTRGHASDYDHWAALGNRGWSYADVLPLFVRSEHHERGATPFHGSGGPLNVAEQRSPNLLTRIYIKAGQQAGYRYNDDFSGQDQEGVGAYQLTQKNGERWSVARAYLAPVRGRANLTVITGAHASRVLMSGKRASGVEYIKDGKAVQLQATREVILSGGAINSPQLLMLSGIGPADELARHGIAPCHVLPGVGKNLQDHLDVLIVHRCAKAVSLGVSLRNVLSPLLHLVNYLLFRKGPYTSNAAEGGGFVKSSPELPAPDLQFHFTPASLDEHGHTLSRAAYTLLGHGYALHVCDLRPKSRGEIRLASADPSAPALIDPNYLSHPDDLASLVRGIKAARRVLAAPAFDPYRGAELFPGAEVQSDSEIEAFIRRKAGTIYHPVGTCKMGSDPMAVVDDQLRVHGVSGLRVVDASIMPTLIGGNTNAPTVMIAEKAADLILADALAPPAGGRPAPRMAMMQRWRWHWQAALALVLALAGAAAFAATPGQLRFEQINAESGLPHSSITAILQDRDGFMWLAGQGGLSRYDGYRFLNYKNEPADPRSIADNSVQALHQDSAGRLWVGSRNGLQRYDARTDNFTSVLVQVDEGRKGDYYDVRKIVSDAQGVLWVATRTGLVRYDPATGRASFLRHQAGVSDSLASDDVSGLVFDADGGLWVGTSAGVDYLAPGKSTFSHFTLGPGATPKGKLNAVKAVALGPDQTLWVGSVYGLEVWQLGSGAPVGRRSFGAAQGLPASPVTSLYRDQAGTMWVGTQWAGLLRWGAEAGTFAAHAHQTGDRGSLADNYVSSIFRDRTGILWAGTWFGGISRTDLTGGGFRHVTASAPGQPQGLSGNKISDILDDGPDGLWVSIYGGGLNRLDLKSGKVTVYRHQPDVPGSLNEDLIVCMGRDADGNVWVGTRNRGLSRFDPASGRFTPWPDFGPDDASDFIQAIVPDRAGKLWVATRGGLRRLDTRTGAVVAYRHDAADPDSLADNFVWNVLEDSRGRLWVGTSHGLDLLDRDSGRFTHFRLSQDRISFLHEGRDGALWVGTGGGLNRLDTDAAGKVAIRSWLVKDGMPNPAVNGILEDEKGQLWISTDGGIVNFDPVREVFRTYTGRDGMAEGDYFVGSAFRMQDGLMAFGSFNNGLTLLRPSEVRGNRTAPQVRITDFQIFNESVRGGHARDGFAIDGPIHAARHIALPHTASMFSLEFAALHFADPRRNRYRYQLGGVDQDWVATDAGKRYASYTNLAPGDYLFRVQASNKDGVWNEDGVALAITIAPPFWATWWFRLATACLLIGATVGAYKLRVRALVGQKGELERQVRQRTSEVVQQKESVELAQRNIALLGELGKRITSKLDRDAIMHTVQRHVLALMDADVFGFGVCDKAGERIDFMLVTAGGEQRAPVAVMVADAGQLAGWPVRHARDLMLGDVEREAAPYVSDAAPRIAPLAAAVPAASLIYAPMLFNGKVVGVLAVHCRRAHAYQRMHVDMLATLASYTAVAMDNAATYEQLASAQQQLVLNEKMAALGTLSAGIAHEINNPTNYAHAGAQLMAEDLQRFRLYLLELAGPDAPPDVRASLEQRIDALVQQLATITDGTARIGALVRDLGTFSRIDHGDLKPMALGPGLRATVQLVRTMYSKVAELQCELAVDPPVLCRPAQMNQVFMNLIVNACQAIEAKQALGGEVPGLLRISSRIEDGQLCIDVEDSGSGIDADLIGRIYDPFFTTKPTGEGTGLGLSISFGIVEQHHGQLRVRSVAGEGTCFTVCLPLPP